MDEIDFLLTDISAIFFSSSFFFLFRFLLAYYKKIYIQIKLLLYYNYHITYTSRLSSSLPIKKKTFEQIASIDLGPVKTLGKNNNKKQQNEISKSRFSRKRTRVCIRRGSWRMWIHCWSDEATVTIW